MDRIPVLPVDLQHPDPRLIEHAARLLLDGEVLAAPSDTVYGFLALPRSEQARECLTRLKGRPGPFLVLVSKWSEARSWTREVPESIWKRLSAVWPGPVTVILPTDPSMPGSKDGGIGLRMPDSAFMQCILEATGEPLFSTSANPPGREPPVTAEEVSDRFDRDIALILDGGPAASAEVSTLVDLTGSPRVLRAGQGDPSPLLDRGGTPS